MNKLLLRACLALGLAPLLAQAAPDRLPASLSTPATPGASTGATVPGPLPWQQMTPVQQHQRRSEYASWRALPESERQRVRQAAARFAALPPAEQQKLREQFGAQDQAFRDGWRLGPTLLGEQYGKLRGMFGFVPASQRQATLAVLHDLTAAQLTQLTLVAQRTPPQDREQVREALLALPPAQRDAWLKQQAGH